MGAASSSSRVWSELCAIQSDSVRAQVLERVLSSDRGASYVADARRSGLYSPVLSWLTAYRSGLRTPFPYQIETAAETIELVVEDNPRYAMYTTPVARATATATSHNQKKRSKI